jgi:hypothetical protein
MDSSPIVWAQPGLMPPPDTRKGMRIGYADPPYIGCAHLYKDHADFSGEVDHAELVDRLESERMTDNVLIATIALDEWLDAKARIAELEEALRLVRPYVDISLGAAVDKALAGSPSRPDNLSRP